ncbi:MAG: HXXEE domain-containing protein [Nanoarchaeota archaeon]
MKFLSKKLKNIILISILIFIAHGLEEYFTGFYDVDIFFNFFIKLFGYTNLNQAIFITFEIVVWLFLIISFFLIKDRKFILFITTIWGLILIFELHHLIKALLKWDYYPGTVTAILLLIIGFFYWKELIINLKAT